MRYVLRPTQNDVLHYGVSHLKSKTGRGSGRYPWGSGKSRKRYSEKERDAIRKTKKAINTVASNYAKPKVPSHGKMGQMLDDMLINESNEKAKKDYNEAMTILGKNKIEQIIKTEKYKSLIIPNTVGLAAYAYAIGKAPASARSMVIKTAAVTSVLSLPYNIYKTNRNYSKASNYLNNKK